MLTSYLTNEMALRERKIKPREDCDFLHLEVLDFTVGTDASINYAVSYP